MTGTGGLNLLKTYKFLLNKPKFFKLPFIPPIEEMRHRRAVDTPVLASPRQGKAIETTTEDVVLFTPGQKVSLEVPGQLFGSSFTLVTNISQIVGSLIQNSAERTARIFESMKPFLQAVFGVRSLTITRDGPQDNAL